MSAGYPVIEKVQIWPDELFLTDARYFLLLEKPIPFADVHNIEQKNIEWRVQISIFVKYNFFPQMRPHRIFGIGF